LGRSSAQRTTGKRAIHAARRGGPQAVPGDGTRRVRASLGSLLGAHDIETGDDEFDETFVVEASSELDVLALLSPAVRAAFKECPDTLVLDYKDGLITAKWWGHERDRRMLTAVLELVVALATAAPLERPVRSEPRVRRVSPRAERRRRLREAQRDSE
jgi:hypothetical protein